MHTATQIKPKQGLNSFFDSFIQKSKADKSVGEIEKANHNLKNNLPLIDEQNRQSFDRRGSLLVETLNGFISSGVTFEISETDFETTGRELSKPEKEYLAENSDLILCFLQQSLLQKRLFADRKDLFNDFAESIYEREAILLENGKQETKAYFETVQMQTRTWYARLLDAN